MDAEKLDNRSTTMDDTQKGLHSGLLFLSVFLVIAGLRWQIVDSPPYYDFAFSFWSEANFLAEHDFDWMALHRAPFLLSEHSGPRAYFTTVLPTIAAFGIWWSPTTTFPLIFYHLFTFACAAIVFVKLKSVMARRLGEGCGLLVATAAFLTPVYCTQVDMLGMEVPLAAFAMMTTDFVDRRRFVLAVITAFGAFAMKATGMILMIALVAVLGMSLVSALIRKEDRRGGSLYHLGVAFVLACLLLGGEHYILKWGDTFSGQLMAGAPLAMMLVWCPDLVILVFVAAFVGAIVVIRRAPSELASIAGSLPSRVIQATVGNIAGQPAVVFSILTMMGILLAVTTGPHLPRYFAFVVPLFYFVFASAIFSLFHRRTAIAIFATLVVVNLVNWNGLLFPDMGRGLERMWGVPAAALARSGSFYERSHEYLADHRSTIEAMRFVDQHRSDGQWIMGMPFSYYLAYPSFGYVKSPVLGYSVNGITGVIPAFKETDDLYREMPTAPIFIKEANYFYAKNGSFQIPDPKPGDEILYRDSQAFPLLIFRKKWREPDPSTEEVKEFYQRQKWPEEQFAGSVYFLLHNSGLDDAIVQVSKVHVSKIASPEQQEWISDVLGALLLKAGRTDEARSILKKNRKEGAGLAVRPSRTTRDVKTKSRFEQELQSTNLNAFELGVLCLKHLRLEDAATYFREYCQLSDRG